MKLSKREIALFSGLAILSACSTYKDEDRKPELAQQNGFYLDQKDTKERGGIDNYVSRTPMKQEAGQVAVNTVIPAIEDHSQMVYFKTGSDKISNADLPLLDTIATQMQAAPTTKVRVDGFADQTGSMKENVTLSQKRAQSVSQYLQSKGVAPDQLKVASFGEKGAPLASNGSKNNPDQRKAVISLAS